MKNLALITILLGLTAGSAQAAVVATQGFADIGTPTADGSPTGDINSATIFTLGDLVSTSANTGALAGLPTQSFGSISFDLGKATSLSFSSAAFGTFTRASISEKINAPGTVAIYVLGDWTPGTFGGVTSGSYDSSFTISFTETPPGSGSLSDSATFSSPPAAPPGTVPEPSTWAMMLIGFAGLGFAGYRASRKGAALAA
jgi:PEP-CTERM motif